ncbi:MAG: SDR family NAD(P)-dependent oxidoreductase, partial [Halieaceae bacterium]
MSAFDLSERVAVVTGGNAGIGLGIAQGLGEAGARVMICGRRDAANDAAIDTLRSAGCDAHSIAIDVTDRDQLRTLFAHTRETLGPVDILVNNAGIFRGSEPETFESSDWEAVLDTNLSQVVFA